MQRMISIIIVNWNKRNLLDNCLKSLQAQTYKDFEIIVVDNGSTDGSTVLVKNIYPKVKLIPLSENKGFATGNNIGIRNTVAEYIALLNNDMEAHPKWLERISLALQKSQNIGFCASKILNYNDRNTIDSAGDIFYAFGIARKRGHIQKDNEEFSKNREIFGACAGAVLYRKQMLNDIGFFDEQFSPAHYEDVDLSFRAQLKGYKCIYIADAIVYHHGHSTLSQFSPKHLYLCSRNIGYVLIKNMPLSLLLKYCFAIALYNIISFLGHIRRGSMSPFLLGKISIFQNLRYLYNQRRIIQSGKVVSNEYIDSILTHYNSISLIVAGYKGLFFSKDILT